MQPKLFPIEQKFKDYRKKTREEGLKVVSEMLKQPYSLQQAEENLDKLREERNSNKY